MTLAQQIEAHLGAPVTVVKSRTGGLSISHGRNHLFISPHNLGRISPENCAVVLGRK